jgi:glycerol-3-phosphate dehydrogenase (NAD(P)+)
VSANDAVAVLGAGNWGTTLAQLVADNGFDVRLWSRDPEQVREMRETRQNPRAMPGLVLSPRVHPTSSLDEAVRGAEVVLVVVPAQAMRQVSRALGELLEPSQLVLHASKGLELATLARMTEVLSEETCARRVGVIAGPNIAPEIAAGQPAGTVAASRFPEVVRAAKRLCTSSRFLVFGGTDVVGVELAGALKNVVAIAAGMAHAMHMGENAMSLLVTRGLAEITAIATSLGARPATLSGLAGVGDLMVTCRSHHSRNHRIGEALARGEALAEAVARLGMVAEGVTTSIAARQLAERRGLECPLLDRVHRVLHEGLAPADALEELLRLRAGRDVAWT